MKRYISAVLIPCFLLQVTGCYSQREIKLAEFNQYDSDNPILITKDSITYYFKNNITPRKIIQNENKNLVTNGIVKNDTLSFNLMMIDPNRPSTGMAKMICRPISLSGDSIKSFYISEFDLGQTALLVGIVAVVWGILVIVVSNMPDLSAVNL
jgi:hypothetical protein